MQSDCAHIGQPVEKPPLREERVRGAAKVRCLVSPTFPVVVANGFGHAAEASVAESVDVRHPIARRQCKGDADEAGAWNTAGLALRQ